LAERLGQGDQLLQQGQLVFQGLEGRGGGAGLGLALRQGLQALGIHGGIHLDGATAEAVVLQLALRADLQQYGEGSAAAPGLEGSGLGEGWGQQGHPAAAQAEAFALLP